jgi:CO/xanthine dehydrogenase FAD-binding subunit
MMLYFAPDTPGEAVELLRSFAGEIKVMAGGTDLLVRLANGGVAPRAVMDLKKMPETCRIARHESGAYSIGAAVCGAVISEHAELKQCWPGVTEAMDLIGSVQIQGRATLAGNLCNASPAADSVPAMITARAWCRILGAGGERLVPVEDFIVAPGRTCLRDDEFVVSIELPPRTPGSADAYLRMTPRSEMDIAIAGAAVNLCVDKQGRIEQAFIALSAVAPLSQLVGAAADILLGSKLEENTDYEFRRRVRAACRPINDKRGTIDYRTAVAAVLASRAAAIAYKRAVDGQQTTQVLS